MPQGMLPFFPAGVTEISSALAFMQEEGRITYFNYQMPVFIHEAKDVATFRMITAQFCVNGNAKQAEIVRAFGVTPISVKRSVKKYREEGPRAFYVKKPGRGASILTEKVLSEAQKLLDDECSTSEISEQLNLKENTIIKAILAGKLSRKKKSTLPAVNN